MQAQAYLAQWQLQQSMCAEYHIVAHDHPEVETHVPRAADKTVLWHARPEDTAFASSLAGVVWTHVGSLASLVQNGAGQADC